MAIFCKPTATQLLTIMVFWGQIQNYMMRANVSILIVAMVKDRDTASSSNTTYSLTCMQNRNVNNITNANTIDTGGHHPYDSTPEKENGNIESVKFDWGPFKQGLVLAAFSYGYVTTQIIGG